MGLVSPRDLFARASAGNFGLGAFNVFSLESLIAVLEAAEAQHAPAIVQISMGARAYVRHLDCFVATVKCYAERCSAPLFLQHDHCSTVAACQEAIDAGVQAVMFDGSHLDFEENIAQTAEVATLAHARDVWVEAELGCLPGFEDLVFSEEAVYTDPELVGEFIDRTGCDSLAIAVGTSHGGVKNDGCLPFKFDLLEQIVRQRPGYPFVLHGGASLPPELIDDCNAQGGRVEHLRNCSEADIAKAVRLGVRKINMDVDNFLPCTTGIRQHLNEKPALYDPRKYLAQGFAGFRAEVEHKLKNVLMSAGQGG